MQATLNITYLGHNGDLPDSVDFDASDEEIRRWASEALQGGDIPGMPGSAGADFTDFVVDRFAAHGTLGYRLMLRPKTAFG